MSTMLENYYGYIEVMVSPGFGRSEADGIDRASILVNQARRKFKNHLPIWFIHLHIIGKWAKSMVRDM